jgi:hypothetical protein
VREAAMTTLRGKTALVTGVIPPSVLNRADEVIE